MEPRRLPCGGAKPLRRLPHAAQSARRRKGRHAYAGAVVDNWIAPPLTAANPDSRAVDPGRAVSLSAQWREQSCTAVAAGPMAPVVHGLSALPDADVGPIAVYFADIDHAGERAASVDPAVARAMSYALPWRRAGERCRRAPLHGRLRLVPLQLRRAPLAVRPDLALNSALNLPDPTNFIQVVLHGIDAEDGIPGVVMPSFGAGAQRRRHRPHRRLSAPHAHELCRLGLTSKQKIAARAPSDHRIAMRCHSEL